MNRRIMITAATLIFAGGFALTTWAQPGPGGKKAPRAPAEQMQRKAGGMSALKLTEEQRSQIAALRLATEKEVAPLKAEMVKLHTDLKLLLTSDAPDIGKIETTNKNIGALQAKIQFAMARQQVEVRKLLTPEQRQKFDARLLSDRKGPRRRAQRGGPHEAPRPRQPRPGERL